MYTARGKSKHALARDEQCGTDQPVYALLYVRDEWWTVISCDPHVFPTLYVDRSPLGSGLCSRQLSSFSGDSDEEDNRGRYRGEQ
jgi:hypothetical protein